MVGLILKCSECMVRLDEIDREAYHIRLHSKYGINIPPRWFELEYLGIDQSKIQK